MTDPLSQALSALPHGPEFRFLDRLLSLEPGRQGTGEYRLRGDEGFLRGHFPGEPMMPGVLLVESAAQLAGVVAQSDPDIPPLPGLKLAAIRGAKMTGTARPGEVVQLHALITGRLGHVIHASVSASVSQTQVLQAELILACDASAQVIE
jgi:3-hydroxyacyl-[acyl-carrier-protein] dehydratase